MSRKRPNDNFPNSQRKRVNSDSHQTSGSPLPHNVVSSSSNAEMMSMQNYANAMQMQYNSTYYQMSAPAWQIQVQPPLPQEPPPDSVRPPPPPEEPTTAKILATQNMHSQRSNYSDLFSRPPPSLDNYGNCINPLNKNMIQSRNNKKRNKKKNKNNNQNQQQISNENKLMSPPPRSTPKQIILPSNLNNSEDQVIVNKKHKRKPMGTKYNMPKDWNLEDAKRALEAEIEFNNMRTKVPSLVLKFPDPEVSQNIVKGFSSSIQSVRFQQPYCARYCSVQLTPGADVQKVIEEISQIKFGDGYMSAEVKKQGINEKPGIDARDIDPYTLYIGNLAQNVQASSVKDQFKKAIRYDIGFAQKIKCSRYAFARYKTVDEAIAEFKAAVNCIIDHRSPVVRFRRLKGTIGMSDDQPIKTLIDENEIVEVENEVNDTIESIDENETVEEEEENPTGKTTEEAKIPPEKIKEEPADDYEIEMNEDQIDTKENVLEDAERLMNENFEVMSESDIKQEQFYDDSSDEEDEDMAFEANDDEEHDGNESEDHDKFLEKFCDGENWDKNKPDEDVDIKPDPAELDLQIKMSKDQRDKSEKDNFFETSILRLS